MSTARPDGRPMERLLYEVKKVIVGQDGLLERLLVALLARGHMLVEGVPGLAKTMTIKTMADNKWRWWFRVFFMVDPLRKMKREHGTHGRRRNSRKSYSSFREFRLLPCVPCSLFIFELIVIYLSNRNQKPNFHSTVCCLMVAVCPTMWVLDLLAAC